MSPCWAWWQCTNPSWVTYSFWPVYLHIYIFSVLWLKPNSLRTGRASLSHTVWGLAMPLHPVWDGLEALHQNSPFNGRVSPSQCMQTLWGLPLGQKCHGLGWVESYTRTFKPEFIYLPCEVYPKLQWHIHFGGEFENQGRIIMTLSHSSFQMPSTTFL